LKEEYSLNKMISDIRDIIALRAEESYLTFTIRWDPMLPDRLLGDEGRVRQILLNILNNAVKYTDIGSVNLSVDFVLLKDNKINLSFAVTDTGIGIREEDQKQLFRMFSQVDAKKNREKEGTGLGLAISMRLAELMNGTITVDSTYGKGSKFTVTIEQEAVDFTYAVYNEHPDKYHAYIFMREDEKWGFGRMLNNLQIQIEEEGAVLHAEDSDSTIIFFDMKTYMDVYEATWRNKFSSARMIGLTEIKKAAEETEGIQVLRKPALPIEIMRLLAGDQESDRQEKAGDLYGFEAPEAKILAVDDNRVNLKVITEILKRYEVQIFPVESAQEAIDQIKSGDRYDLILMD
ncbi:MAG TPA: ATP-binding protein, partial [Lachnospiraceae bacterium]|nr:ATP-binding protein [Lachnospiraceae bacterium]